MHTTVVPEGVSTGTSGVTFRATLTRTSNPYLAHRVPLTGYIRIHEFSTTGEIQPNGVTFMPDAKDGTHTSFVSVKDATFVIGTR